MLRVTFEPGATQSQQAAQYFTGAVGALVDGWLDRMEERIYTIDAEEGVTVHLRIWSEAEFGAEELHHLFTWLLILREDADRLQEGVPHNERVARMVDNWLAVRHNGSGFFVEQWVERPEAPPAERPQLSLAVVGGRTEMFSTDNLLFTRLHDGFFGLTLAGHGSYLLEVVGKDGLRKAS